MAYGINALYYIGNCARVKNVRIENFHQFSCVYYTRQFFITLWFFFIQYDTHIFTHNGKKTLRTSYEIQCMSIERFAKVLISNFFIFMIFLQLNLHSDDITLAVGIVYKYCKGIDSQTRTARSINIGNEWRNNCYFVHLQRIYRTQHGDT